MNYSKIQELKNRLQTNLQSVLLKPELITGSLSHLCVSIWALLPRELLEDRGQTAQHKDGTARRRGQALKLQLTNRCNIYDVPGMYSHSADKKLKMWQHFSFSCVESSAPSNHIKTQCHCRLTFILQISKTKN